MAASSTAGLSSSVLVEALPIDGDYENVALFLFVNSPSEVFVENKHE